MVKRRVPRAFVMKDWRQPHAVERWKGEVVVRSGRGISLGTWIVCSTHCVRAIPLSIRVPLRGAVGVRGEWRNVKRRSRMH